MPEFIHSFQRGRMNKDLDERLIPNGEYRDALNLDIANSEGSNVVYFGQMIKLSQRKLILKNLNVVL
jgi:hypothetical protein